jgi:chemotaxis response regulator CheB
MHAHLLDTVPLPAVALPRAAIATGSVDYVLSVDDIAPAPERLVASRAAEAPA